MENTATILSPTSCIGRGGRFRRRIDKLIIEIVQLGGSKELEQTFNLFFPPPFTEFHRSLEEIRDRLVNEARERGWEV
jgi:hypothetical protein